MAAIWAGIDEGKTHHHCVAIDESGHRLLSRRVANDEPELLELLTDVLALGDKVTWGIDLADGGAALVITILLNHDQPVNYISGRTIHRASESYRGEGKTDAKDAAVIADQVRIRRDLNPLRAGDDTAIDLKILAGRRMDLVTDRTRTVNRLRAQFSGIFPGLERALDLPNTGPLTLLTGYQTPAGIRRLGTKRLETWLRNRKVLRADQLAETAVQAAERQHTSLPGEPSGAIPALISPWSPPPTPHFGAAARPAVRAVARRGRRPVQFRHAGPRHRAEPAGSGC